MARFLSHAEIVELTGYKRPADQRRWLRTNGWQFAVAARGRPRVLDTEMERNLVGQGSSSRHEPAPDWRMLP